MRALILICIFALASCQLSLGPYSFRPKVVSGEQTNKDKLQQIFNGIWENVNLADPVQLINCFDEETAGNTVSYIGEALKDVAKGDRETLISDTRNFTTHFPPAAFKCIIADAEVADMARAYNITNQPPAEVLQQVLKYILTNLNDLKKQAGTAYFDWFQGMYKQTGVILGQVLQQVFNGKTTLHHKLRLSINDARTDLQNLFNGLFEDVNLPGPKTALNCFNEHDAHTSLDFFADVISDIATNNYPNLVREYNVYKNSLPTNVTNCIQTNGELGAMYDAYGFNGQTPATILQKYAKYYISHHQQLITTTQKIDAEIGNDDYYQAGKDTGKLIQTILG